MTFDYAELITESAVCVIYIFICVYLLSYRVECHLTCGNPPCRKRQAQFLIR